MPSKRFRRQEWWKKERFRRRVKWRRPRGRKNPMRRRERGRPPMPRVGYRKPRKIRGRHPTGLVEVLVSNVNDLKTLNPKVHIARIRKGVGKRKRMLIIEEARKLGIRVVQGEPAKPEENGKRSA